MRIGLIYSRKPGNLYTGGSNENVQMYALAQGLAPLLRAGGHDVEIPANTDYDGSGSLTYADNTAWLRARNSVKKFDIVISCHSNAMGDACILYGRRSYSQHLIPLISCTAGISGNLTLGRLGRSPPYHVPQFFWNGVGTIPLPILAG